MGELLSSAGPTIWFLAKIFVLIFLSIYIVFAIVIVRQVGLMTRTLELGLESVLKVFAFLHLFFALGIFFIALLVL